MLKKSPTVLRVTWKILSFQEIPIAYAVLLELLNKYLLNPYYVSSIILGFLDVQ